MIRHSKILVLPIVCSFSVYNAYAVSMVYNFRIAETTREDVFAKKVEREDTVLALVFDQFRKKHSGIRQNFAGALASYIFSSGSYYVRADGAFSHIHAWDHAKTTFQDTASDDILFSFGANRANEQTSSTLSGLFGVPTHAITRLKHVDFGTGQVGLGIQFDQSRERGEQDSFLYGLRYIYYVPRKACDPCNHLHTFTLGNIGDILLAYRHNYDHQGIELGYTFRARFGAHCRPPFDDAVEKANYLRSNFYFIYKYKFSTERARHRLLLNIAYGTDHKPKTFGNKAIYTLWGAWQISF